MARIDIKADPSSPDLSPNWQQAVADNRVAFICLRECPENSARVKDDEAVPVLADCKFSVLRDKSKAIWNPCAFFDADSSIGHGVAPGSKAQHILRTNRHLIHFMLVDLEERSHWTLGQDCVKTARAALAR